MPPLPPPNTGALAALDCGLTGIAVAVAFGWPRVGSSISMRVESALATLAMRKRLAVFAVGLGALLLRIAILPLCPTPLPFLPDDFSFLLAADTFGHGRLANPTPDMWTHFEAVHVTMQPTYASMYFPGQGLLLALGKVLLGHPWHAVLISSAIMCAAICWMLQAWLPPRWALLGGALAILRLGLFSYWVNTYTGGGTILAIGGALLLGSLPRFKKTMKSRYAWAMAIGVILLALTRPYEGLLLCLPVSASLVYWARFGKKRPRLSALAGRVAFPLALIVAALVWLGYYDYRAFGSPYTLPYSVNRAAYAMAPYFVWQPPRPEPVYRHQEMRAFYYESEMKWFSKVHSKSLFIPETLRKVWIAIGFFAGFALLPPFIMLRRVILDSRLRFLLICLAIAMAGMLIQIYLIPHYLAPFTALFYALGLQAMRHLRVWRPEGRPVGLAMLRMTISVCVLLIPVRLFAGPLRVSVPQWPAGNWSLMWFGPEHFGVERDRIEKQLEALPGKQLAIVRYAREREPLDQWTYNSADLSRSKVIWAGEVDPASDRDLLFKYGNRQAWLIEPDTRPVRVSPYPLQVQATSSQH